MKSPSLGPGSNGRSQPRDSFFAKECRHELPSEDFSSRFPRGLGRRGRSAGRRLVLGPQAHAAGSDVTKVALIGCGGRGSGAIRDCLSADEAVRVVTVADAFDPQYPTTTFPRR